MKLNSEPAYEVHDTNPHLKRVQVRIHDVAHAMRQFAKSTYSDPIGAVVRETIANAIDAGRGKQFKIQAPGLLDPNFRVRDFGVGMDEEFFTDGYAAVGFSTKRDSNDEIGGFGQGRFAAFAYEGCDQFYVKGFKNHKWFLGSVTRDADFNVYVQVENRGDTLEPDGVEVIIPVRTADHAGFEKKIKIFTEFLDPKPDCEIVPNSRPALFEGKDWKITSLNGYEPDLSGDKLRAVMGGIPYRLDKHKIFQSGGNPIWEVEWGDFHFGIGELSVAASREELQYDNATIAAIEAKFRSVRAELEGMVLGVEAQCKTDWEKWTHPQARALRKIFGNNAGVKVLRSSEFKPLLFHNFRRVNDFSGRSRVVKDRVQVDADKEFHFFLADCKDWFARYRHHVVGITVKDQYKAYVCVLPNEAAWKLCGEPPITKLSSLPKPPPSPRSSYSSAPRDKFMYRPDGEQYDRRTRNYEDTWTPLPADYSTPGIYYPMVISNPDEEFKQLWKLYQFDDRNLVWGIPRSSIEEAEGLGWVRFDRAFLDRTPDAAIEAYSIMAQSSMIEEHAVTNLMKLVEAGLEAPKRATAARKVFERLQMVAPYWDHKHNYIPFLTLKDHPRKTGSKYEFDSWWEKFKGEHPVLFGLLDNRNFDLEDRRGWPMENALELAKRAL